MIRAHVRPALTAVLLVVVASLLWPMAVLAEGGGATAALLFLPGICNWGNTSASGSANVDVNEGSISVEARGLKTLATDVYEVWLVTPGLGQWVSVGRFAGSGGNIEYSAAVDEIPDLDYSYVVITVEPATGDTGEPSGRNAIAGLLSTAGVSASATQAASLQAMAAVAELSTSSPDAAGLAETTAEAEALPPSYLPVSGAPSRLPLATIVGVVAGAALGGMAVIQRRS